MTKDLHNQVRQVLMNELGLTREVIREEMREIITDVVNRHFTAPQINKLIHERIDANLHSGYFGEQKTLEKIAKQVVQDTIYKAIEKHVKVSGRLSFRGLAEPEGDK